MSVPPRVLVLADTEPAATAVVAALRRDGRDFTVHTGPELPDASALFGTRWGLAILVAVGSTSAVQARLEQLRALLPGTPIVLVLQDGDAATALAAVRAGARDALMPAEHDRLPWLITCLLEEAVPVREGDATHEALHQMLVREQQASAQMQAVGAITDAALARGDDASAVYQDLAERIAALLGVYAVSVRLLDAEDRLQTHASHNIPREFWETIAPRPGEATTGRAVSEQRTVYVHDLFASPPATPALARFREQVAARSMLSSPIVVNERIIGVINVFSREIREFSEDEIRLVETAAARVGAVAVQAQLIRATRDALAARDRALGAVEAERDRLRQVLEVLPEGIIIAAPDGSVMLTNAASEQALGRPPNREDASQDSALRARKADGSPYQPAETPLSRALGVGEVVRGEQMTVWNDAERRDATLLVNSAPLRDANQSITGAVAAFQDVTAIKRTEQALRESEARYRLLLELASDAIFTSAPDGRYVDANLRACEMFGYTREEILTMRVGDLADPEGYVAVPIDWKALHEGRVVVRERVMVRKDGSRFHGELSARILPDGQLQAIVRDVTTRKEAEAERAELLTREQAARTRAERAAGRTARLQAVTAALSEALTPDDVVRVGLEQAKDAFGAAAGAIMLLDESGKLVAVGSSGYPRSYFREWRQFHVAVDMPISQAARTGELVIVESAAERAARFPHLSTPAGTSEYGAVAAVPLGAEGRVFGAMNLSFQGDRAFDEEERAVLLAIGRQCALALERARLYESEERARRAADAARVRTAFLAEASEVLGMSLDHEATLRNVARMAIPRFADWCYVYLADAHGQLQPIEVAHVDPAKEPLMRELSRYYPPDLTNQHPITQAMRTGRPVLLPVVDDQFREQFATDDRHLELIRALASRSALVTPLISADQALGTISFGRTRDDAAYGDADLELAEELSRRAVAAIERSRLYAAEQDARAEAEAAREHLAMLAEASEQLATSLELEPTLRAVARLAIPRFADWCNVYLTDDGGRLRSIEVAHTDPAREVLLRELVRDYPPNIDGEDHPVQQAIRDGRAVLLPTITDEWRRSIAVNARHLELMRLLGSASTLVVPLVARDHTLGVISFGLVDTERQYGTEQINLAEELARRAAAAIERARLWEEIVAVSARERSHASRLRRMAACALAVTSALTLDGSLRIIAESAREIVGASMAIIKLTGDEVRRGTGTIIAQAGSRTARGTLEIAAGAGAIAAVLREEKLPPRVPRSELDVRLPSLTQAILSARLPLRGLLAVPLTGREGQHLGVIQLWDRVDGDFTDDDEAALVQLAQFASVEIENERLQRQASAAAAAVEADRLKGELLSTVSHELRTPLAAIKGFTTAMLSYFDRIDREEQHSFLSEIDGAADRLHELVENLLRLSRLEAGTLDFRRAEADPAPMLELALAEARRRYPDRVITLDVAGSLPVISMDVRRMMQVLANLIDNAVKYSPDGGEVELRARALADAGLQIAIADHGIGIPPDHLERVFDRFHRVDNSATREIGGTGLGLAICKRIVEQHGGTIRVTSREGAGSTFTIALPHGDAP